MIGGAPPRPWAIDDPTRIKKINNNQKDRKKIFFMIIKSL